MGSPPTLPPLPRPSTAKTILVIDDQAMAIRAIARILKGRTVVGVTDPRIAGAEVERVQPDLVLVDLHMPYKSGLDIVRKLRLQFTSLPIALMSGAMTHAHTLECIQAGGNSS